ncbi:hypothetical protein HJFPF1_00368 [Paramyrothecium foliicola]|nr:hypothetical protein HJFPF1_00368 [Paramyrothecium foliicola]
MSARRAPLHPTSAANVKSKPPINGLVVCQMLSSLNRDDSDLLLRPPPPACLDVHCLEGLLPLGRGTARSRLLGLRTYQDEAPSSMRPIQPAPTLPQRLIIVGSHSLCRSRRNVRFCCEEISLVCEGNSQEHTECPSL